MVFTEQYRTGPASTPKLIQILIAITAIVSIVSAITSNIFYDLVGSYGPQEWLGLSWYGLNRLFLWQPITFLFVYPSNGGGITLSYLVMLALNMYILWVMGGDVLERIGRSAFLRLYLMSGIVAGLLAILLMPVTGNYIFLSGPAPAVLAVLTAWSLLYPDTIIFLFFVIPIKVKWLLAGILGAITLINLSRFDLVNFIFYVGGPLFAYLYGITAWGLRSPFEYTQAFETKMADLGKSIRRKLTRKKGEIIDIKTGKSQELDDDDRFMDAMLAKISRYGEQSLSWMEKRRMNKIAAKKMQNKQ